MSRGRGFLLAAGLTILVSVLAVHSLGLLIRDVSVFASDAPAELRSEMDRATVTDIVAIKLSHALRAAAPYDVALFGNSRSVRVSSNDIDLTAGRFFNFSVGGTSIRQNVFLLHRLHAEGKAPRTALISLDNLDLMYFGYLYFPLPWERITETLDDVKRITAKDGMLLAGRALANEVILAGRDLIHAFTPEVLHFRLRFLFWHHFRSDRQDAQAERYLLDGSRPHDGLKRTVPLYLPPPAGRLSPLMRSYFLSDLEQLADIQRAGIRIVVYESPLAPSLINERLRTDGADMVNEARQMFMTNCQQLGIECAMAVLPDTQDSDWTDCCHSPAAALGQYLRGLLRPETVVR